MTKAPSPPHDDVAARTNSTYTAAHAAQAEHLCRLGATNVDLAAFFDVAEKTVRNWMRRHAAFAAAVRRGKLTADCAVTEALFQRACGFRRVDVRLFRRGGQPALRRVVRQYPPDTTACIFWLKNRRPDLWRDVWRIRAAEQAAPVTDLATARRKILALMPGWEVDTIATPPASQRDLPSPGTSRPTRRA
ncbi:MAG: hypothetical protein KIT36_09470 [Alphaproteobacteria bacterium]|nr:hypothetical protein [Alphaproteobacteria bacterium]